MADRLTDDTTRHWTRREHPLVSLIRIDGKRLPAHGHGAQERAGHEASRRARVADTHIYDFDDGHVHVTLTFLTPALPEDLDVLARPLTYFGSGGGARSMEIPAHVVSIL